MNELEKEYRDNLQRIARNEERRWNVLFGAYCAFLVIATVLYVVRDGATLRDILLLAPALMLAGAIWIVRLARYLLKRFEDRNVEVSTTERERAYREPVTMNDAHVRRAVPGWLAPLALIPLGVAVTGFGVVIYDPHHYRLDRPIAYGIVMTMAGVILVGKRLYAAWRTRRNARLELKWEKWLDSADACQIGPRKWTK